MRILHVVSAHGADGSGQSPMLSLLARADRSRFAAQLVHFEVGHTQSAIVRQSGVPVHELALSRRRLSPATPQELLRLTREFRPDVVHAWGHSAQLATSVLLKVVKSRPGVVWSMTGSTALPANAGFIDRMKLNLVRRLVSLPHRIVYHSASTAAQYRRIGLPEDRELVISPGVDAERFKPDFAARKRVREKLEIDPKAFVIGMQAPFQPEYDHATFIKATAEIIKLNPHVHVVLAGRGVQRGNAGVMALLGGGTLASRTSLLGEWSDSAALFNACDVVCSTALTDASRLNLAMAMLCGIPCVATAKGAQAEVVGQFGVAAEPGSATALTRSIARVMEMPLEKRAFVAQGARKHALQNYSLAGMLERFSSLYLELGARAAQQAMSLPGDMPEPIRDDAALEG